MRKPTYEELEKRVKELEKAEEELKKFKTISDRAGYGVGIIDIEGNLIYSNESFAQMHGYTAREVTGKHFSIFHTEEQMKNVGKLKKRLKKTGSYVSEEVWHKRKDGTIFSVLMTGSSIKDDKGKPLYLSATAIDITKRKRMEEDLEAERFKLKEYFENLPLLAYNISFDGKIIDLNNVAVKTLGYSKKDELIGKSLLTAVYAPSSRKKAKQLLEKWKKAKKLKNEELQVVTKQGKIIDVLLNTDTIFDNNSVPIHSISTHLDITERKKAEELLQESRNRYARAEEMGQFGHWDRNFIENKCIWSDGTYRIFGVRKDEFIPKYENFLNLVHPSDREPTKSAVNSSLSHGKKHDIEYRIIRPDGTERVINSIAEVGFNRKGQPARLIGTVHDITERKRAEEKLEKYRHHLEDLVKERTAKFVLANEKLKKEIKERRRAEEVLQENEKKLKILFNYAPDSYYLNDLKGKFIDCNIAAEKMIGYKKEELIGKSFLKLKLLQPEQILKAAELSAKNALGQPTGPDEFTLNRKDGKQIVIETRKFPIKIKDKIMVLGNARDITERKEAEEALKKAHDLLEIRIIERTAKLREKNKLLIQEIASRNSIEKELLLEQSKLELMLRHKSLLVEIASMMHTSKSFYGILNEIMKKISEKLETMKISFFHFSQENLKATIKSTVKFESGHPHIKETKSIHLSELPPMLLQSFKKGQIIMSSDLSEFGKEEKKFLNQLNVKALLAFPLKVAGKISEYFIFSQHRKYQWEKETYDLLRTIVNIISDALEKDHHFQSLLDAEEKHTESAQLAEKALRLASIGFLSAGVAHEINQPLTALKVMVDGMLYWGEEKLKTTDIIRNLQFISNQAGRIDEIIKQMRMLSSQENARKLTQIDINDSVKKALSLIERQLGVHNINVVFKPDTLLPTVYGNSIQMQLVVSNLVINAMYELGAHSIQDKSISITTKFSKGRCKLKILDNGPGIPKEYMYKIFEPFFTTKEGNEGLGLGLFITKNIVDGFKGTISVKNRKRGGAFFTVSIPTSTRKKEEV
ncbi:PAS domain S-box protein [candidate division KSB1 bacterium]